MSIAELYKVALPISRGWIQTLVLSSDLVVTLELIGLVVGNVEVLGLPSLDPPPYILLTHFE